MRGADLAALPSLTADVMAPDAISKLSSQSSTPTNAIALAVLDALPQWATAAEAVAAGVPAGVAQAFLPPSGIFPWMRVVAFGLDGGLVRDPADADWWAQPFPLELYAPAGTWADIVAKQGNTHFAWDDALASGDSSAIAQTMMASAQELEDVVESEACPKFIVPKTRGMLPVPNPQCWKADLDKLKDTVDKLHGRKSNAARSSFLFWIAFGYLVIRGKL